MSLPNLLPCLAGAGCRTGTLNWDAVMGSILGCCTGMLLMYWDAVLGCHTMILYWDAILGCCTGFHTGMPYWDVILGGCTGMSGCFPVCSAPKQLSEGRGRGCSSCPTLKDRTGCLSPLLFPALPALPRSASGERFVAQEGNRGHRGAGDIWGPGSRGGVAPAPSTVHKCTLSCSRSGDFEPPEAPRSSAARGQGGIREARGRDWGKGEKKKGDFLLPSHQNHHFSAAASLGKSPGSAADI